MVFIVFSMQRNTSSLVWFIISPTAVIEFTVSKLNMSLKSASYSIPQRWSIAYVALSLAKRSQTADKANSSSSSAAEPSTDFIILLCTSFVKYVIRSRTIFLTASSRFIASVTPYACLSSLYTRSSQVSSICQKYGVFDCSFILTVLAMSNT